MYYLVMFCGNMVLVSLQQRLTENREDVQKEVRRYDYGCSRD